MRINTNIGALNAHRNLSRTNDALSRSMAKLSSGFRINRASDDAAGLAIANKFEADIRSMQAASRNVAEATSLIQIAEGGASSLQDILVRMKELATQSASANAASQTATIGAEYDALVEEIDRIVGGTEYQDVALLDGSFSGTFQVGSGTTANDVIAVSLSNLDSSTLTVAAGDIDGTSTAIDNVDAALTAVNSFLGDIGAYQNRLDYAAQNLATSIQNYSASESVIRDVDMAAEMTNFSKNQILQQAGTAMLAQANASAQGVLQLLRG
ncbi:MAG TPA: flagellin [Longimicrobiaceae bacterium]|nr:flagellin [Longimicrobiaceae bacterium]